MNKLLLALFLLSAAARAEVPAIQTELQWSLCPADHQNAVEALGLSSEEMQERQAYYFDKREGDFYKDGVILRLRLTSKKQSLTVKVRNVDVRAVPAKFWDMDFKCENDKHGSRSTMACSLNSKPSRADADDLIQRKKIVMNVLSAEQKEFLRFARVRLDGLADVQPLGPVDQMVWKFEREDLSDDIALEFSRVGREFTGLQYSIRVPSEEASSVEARAQIDLGQRGLVTCAVEPPSALAHLLSRILQQ